MGSQKEHLVLPDFNLMDALSEQKICMDDILSPEITVLIFLSNDCACDKYILDHLIAFTDDYIGRRVSFVAVNPNDAGRNASESFDAMRNEAQIMDFPFPYLFDPEQDLARALQPQKTPEFLVFNAGRVCLYRGPYDDATPDNGKEVSGKYLGNVLEAYLAGESITYREREMHGCDVLWKQDI